MTKMTTTMKFELKHIKSTVEVQADSSLKEVDGFRYPWGGPGTVFPDLDAWVSTMIAATKKGFPWYIKLHNWKLSYCPPNAAERSSVVWVPSKKHYMEVRRGDKTTFTETERRYWLSWEDWATGVCGAEAEAPAIQVKEEPAAAAEMPAAVPVVEAVDDPFDSEAFKEEYARLKEWLDKQTDPHTYSAGIVQATTWLLTATVSADTSAWVKENPAWRYSVRAVIQAYGWKAAHKEAKDAVAAFLEKF